LYANRGLARGVITKSISMSYSSNPKVRKAIDELLRLNARLQANLGTKSRFDIGNRSAADQLWVQWLVEIRVLDKDFYEDIATREEKEMVSKKIYSKVRFRAMTKASV